MSWAEIKKINSNLDVPLNELFPDLLENHIKEAHRYSIRTTSIQNDTVQTRTFLTITGHGLLLYAAYDSSWTPGSTSATLRPTINIDGTNISQTFSATSSYTKEHPIMFGLVDKDLFSAMPHVAYENTTLNQNLGIVRRNTAPNEQIRSIGSTSTLYYLRDRYNIDILDNPIEFKSSVSISRVMSSGGSAHNGAIVIYTLLD